MMHDIVALVAERHGVASAPPAGRARHPASL
jgi:hypothetical protein